MKQSRVAKCHSIGKPYTFYATWHSNKLTSCKHMGSARAHTHTHTHTHTHIYQANQNSTHKQIPPCLTPSSHPVDLFNSWNSNEKSCIEDNALFGLQILWFGCDINCKQLKQRNNYILHFTPDRVLTPKKEWLRHSCLSPHTHTSIKTHTYQVKVH